MARRSAARRLGRGPLLLFLLVFAATFTFGVWMASRGFRWGDSMSRAASALAVVSSADPKLANIGFVWPPLPTLLDALGALFYPLWPDVVSSGVSAALTTALCAGATAALLLMTARGLGLSNWIGWAFALLVAANPMLFLYASNGMPEGVAAPFFTGAVCCLTLFWHTGQRLWIAGAGTALALAVATAYQGVAFGAAIFVALVAGVFWTSEARVWAPQGRVRAVEGLGLLLVVPPAFAGLLWLGANAVIMGDPLEFIYGDYGYAAFQNVALSVNGAGGPIVTGDVVGALTLVGERVGPFLIPLAFVLVARLLDGRLLRINSLSVTMLGLSVPLGMVFPMALLGSPMGFLRYLIYPLFVAAGWGLYEIASSRRRGIVVALVLAGWVAAFPAALWAISTPRVGVQERDEVTAVTDGHKGRDPVVMRTPVANYLEAHVLGSGRNVVVDSVEGASMIVIQIRPAYARQLILTYDSRFRTALAHAGSHHVGYFVMPDPARALHSAIAGTYPKLWNGRQPGFRLVKTVATQLEKWRIYAVQPGVRHRPQTTGGDG